MRPVSPYSLRTRCGRSSFGEFMSESFGQGSTTGSSSNNSMSYGGSRPARMRSGQGQSTRRHSNKRVHMATERLWVCQGCQAPKSDWSPAMKQGLLYALGGGGVLVYMLMGGFSAR